MPRQEWEYRCFNCMTRLSAPGEKCRHCGWDNRERRNGEGRLEQTVLNNQYLIGRALGRGGFGITYAAFDMNLNRRVAIKEFFPVTLAYRQKQSAVVRPYADKTREFEEGIRKALEEGRTMATMAGVPNVVRVFTAFRENGTVYIVMEYIEGITLTGLVKWRGPLEWRQALTVLYPIMRSLEGMHAMGLIHRDVSPDNIMLRSATGETVLLDFGTAREARDGLTVALRPGYAPMEQYSERERQDGRVDEYALCATMYFLLTGSPPKSADMRTYVDGDPNAPVPLDCELPPRVAAVLQKGLSLSSNARYDTVEALERAFEQAEAASVAGEGGPEGGQTPAGAEKNEEKGESAGTDGLAKDVQAGGGDGPQGGRVDDPAPGDAPAGEKPDEPVRRRRPGPVVRQGSGDRLHNGHRVRPPRQGGASKPRGDSTPARGSARGGMDPAIRAVIIALAVVLAATLVALGWILLGNGGAPTREKKRTEEIIIWDDGGDDAFWDDSAGGGTEFGANPPTQTPEGAAQDGPGGGDQDGPGGAGGATPTPKPTPKPVTERQRMIRDFPTSEQLKLGTGGVLGSDHKRVEVTEIVVVDSLAGAPESAWDVSEAGNRGVLAWLNDTTLIIAGKGGVTAPRDAGRLFAGYPNLKAVRFKGCFYTQDTESLAKLFFRDAKLEEVDLTGFCTGRAADLHEMFNKCSRLKTVTVDDSFLLLDAGELDTRLMFEGCSDELRVVTDEGKKRPADWLASATVTPDLQRGDRGDSVRWLQRGLKALGYLEGLADGDFGAKTEAALRAFQGDQGLEEDGVADAECMRALCDRL